MAFDHIFAIARAEDLGCTHNLQYFFILAHEIVRQPVAEEFAVEVHDVVVWSRSKLTSRIFRLELVDKPSDGLHRCFKSTILLSGTQGDDLAHRLKSIHFNANSLED